MNSEDGQAGVEAGAQMRGQARQEALVWQWLCMDGSEPKGDREGCAVEARTVGKNSSAGTEVGGDPKFKGGAE